MTGLPVEIDIPGANFTGGKILLLEFRRKKKVKKNFSYFFKKTLFYDSVKCCLTARKFKGFKSKHFSARRAKDNT